jgi:hypothetical protein
MPSFQIAGWSSLVARQAHNLKVAGSNPAPATTLKWLAEWMLHRTKRLRGVVALCIQMQPNTPEMQLFGHESWLELKRR